MTYWEDRARAPEKSRFHTAVPRGIWNTVCRSKCEFFQFFQHQHLKMCQLRSYLSLLNYYGKFIKNLSSLQRQLHQLLCHGKAWKWTQQCEAAFVQTKKALLESDALIHFDPTLHLQLACDASPYVVGAVISHIMPNGEERPIAFASRTLSKAESNYAQIEREALGIVLGVRKFTNISLGEDLFF